jgi:hypothetical protein
MTLIGENKTYSDRMQNFVVEASSLNNKYEPYLEIHEIDDLRDCFDIVQIPGNKTPAGKIIWKDNYDLPVDIVKDVMLLFSRHFVD